MTDEKRNEPINAIARAAIDAAMERSATPEEVKKARIKLLLEHIENGDMSKEDVERAIRTIAELQANG